MSKKSSVFIWIIALILVMGGSYAFLESQKDAETDEDIMLKPPSSSESDSEKDTDFILDKEMAENPEEDIYAVDDEKEEPISNDDNFDEEVGEEVNGKKDESVNQEMPQEVENKFADEQQEEVKDKVADEQQEEAKDKVADEQQNEVNKDNNAEIKQTETDVVRVPDIRLSSTLGESVSIRDYDDKVLVIYYWASWCPPCIFGMPEIQEIHEQFEQRDDLKLIAVNATDGVRETKEVATRFLNDNNYTFLSLFDENSRIGNFFGISFIPSVFVIDRQGVVYKQINKDDIIRTVNEVI